MEASWFRDEFSKEDNRSLALAAQVQIVAVSLVHAKDHRSPRSGRSDVAE